jgi:hypothetical protein
MIPDDVLITPMRFDGMYYDAVEMALIRESE